jgi:hypothetical protein
MWLGQPTSGDARSQPAPKISVVGLVQTEIYEVKDIAQWQAPVFELWAEWVSEMPPSKMERKLLGIAKLDAGGVSAFRVGSRVQIRRPGIGACVGMLEVSLCVAADKEAARSEVVSAANRLRIRDAIADSFGSSAADSPHVEAPQNKSAAQGDLEAPREETVPSPPPLSVPISVEEEDGDQQPRSGELPTPISLSPKPWMNEEVPVGTNHERDAESASDAGVSSSSEDFSLGAPRLRGYPNMLLPLQRRQLQSRQVSKQAESGAVERSPPRVSSPPLQEATAWRNPPRPSWIENADSLGVTHVLDISLVGCAGEALDGLDCDPSSLGFYVFYSITDEKTQRSSVYEVQKTFHC